MPHESLYRRFALQSQLELGVPFLCIVLETYLWDRQGYPDLAIIGIISIGMCLI